MATFDNGFEGGTPPNAIGTSSATGSAFAATEASVIYSSGQVMHGSMAAAVFNAGASTGTARITATDATVAFRGYFYLSLLPDTSGLDLLRMTYTGDVTAPIIRFLSTGQCRLLGVGGTTLWTSTATVAINTWYRMEGYFTAGTTASNGSARAAFYSGDSSTALDDSTLLTGVNTASTTGSFLNARTFKTSAGSWTGNLWMDDIAVRTNTEATGLIGPSVTSSPLALAGVVTPSTHTVGQTQTLTLTATGGNSNPLSYSVTWDGTNLGPQSSNVFTHTDATAKTVSWSATVSQSA